MANKRFSAAIKALQQQYRQQLPPVDQWHPELSGDIDIVIQADGSWVHEGSPIQRSSLVKLFASILKREGNDYFLVTPVEKWRIKVVDCPFIASAAEPVAWQGEGSAWVFTSNVEDKLALTSEQDFELRSSPQGLLPYVQFRPGLWGRLGRNVYYQLVENATAEGADLCFSSAGLRFSLGQFQA